MRADLLPLLVSLGMILIHRARYTNDYEMIIIIIMIIIKIIINGNDNDKYYIAASRTGKIFDPLK